MNLKKKTKEERLIEKLVRKSLKPTVKKKASKSNSSSVPKQTAKLVKIFNEMIRVNDSIESTGSPFHCKCCTCNNIVTNSNGKLDAGHFIKSRHQTVKFHTKNVHGQCRKCNSFMGGNDSEYSRFIIEKYGLAGFDWLMAQKFVTKQFKAFELIEMQVKFSALLDKLIEPFPEYKRKSPKATKI